MRLVRRVGPSLASGHAGFALAHAALDQAFPRSGHALAARSALARAIDGLAATALTPSLFNGFVGVAWVTEFLVGDIAVADVDDPCRLIDEALEVYLDVSPWKRQYDLCEGLVGVGVYALERLPRASANRLLARVVDRLNDAARPRRHGIAWWSDPDLIRAPDREKPHLAWNLGLAHGIPGVIGVLGRICAADLIPRTRDKARVLLDGAVTWLMAQELPRARHGCFASGVGPRLTREPARLGWCYGDLGVAAALLVAARAVREPAWEATAVRIAMRASLRPEEACGVIDQGLCHGSAGVAHIFHRMFLTTGERRFADASRFWFRRTLEMRHASGFAGVRAFGRRAYGKLGWKADASFLTGAGGVALALLGATTEVDPAWDRAMLLS